jgi:colanic acid biosynthesis glycosyl transferase WcaI
MHVLILIIQFPPDVNSSGILMAQLGEGLVARGHQVSVVTTFPHYANFRVTDEYRGKVFERSTYRGMDVLRLCVYAPGNKQSMKHRLLSYLSFSLLATLGVLISRQNYDMILCSNGSFFSGLAAAAIGAVKRIPFIYNVQDLYPATPVQAGQLRNPIAIRALEWLEKFMYRRAAHVSVISGAMRQNIIDRDIPSDKVSTIANFVDTDFIQPLAKVNAFSQRLGLTDKFVVTHAGNVGYVYDLETLLETAAMLQMHRDIQFLIVGDGVLRPKLEAKAQASGLRNVTFLPFQAREELPLLRAASDVQVALYRRGSARYSMPSKVYEIMASGRPVLASADEDSDLWNLVHTSRCGICITPHNASLMASAIMALHDDPPLRARMGERGRLEAEGEYSVGAVVSRYDDLIRSIDTHRQLRDGELLETQV